MTEQSGDMTAAFSAALESASTEPAVEASPASPPVTETPPAEPNAPAAITQAATEPPAPESASADKSPTGEPPVWRWQDILENARKEHDLKGYERAKQEVESQYADFKGLSADERAGLVVWNRALQGDPQALWQVSQVHPQLAAALSGKPAETSQAPEPEPQPDAAIQLADGSQVPVYTPDGMRKREAWLQKQLGTTLEQQLAEKFKPALSIAERLQQQDAREQQWQQELQTAARFLAPLKRLPYFEEFKPALQKALTELPKDFRGDLHDLLADTFAELSQAKFAALTKHGEAQALASIHQRTVAGTTNPNTAQATTPKKFAQSADGFADALSHFATG